jgi:hypothetical protein
MLNVLKNLFGKRKDKEFVALIQAALEDKSIRQDLLTVLAFPQPQRLSQLQKWEFELEREHAPQPLISAIGFLKDADIADRTLEILANINTDQ